MSEQYLPGYGAETARMLTARTLEGRAPVTAAYLHDVARVLDVGCGPGTITAGLADRAGPAAVVTGVDASPSQLRAAARTGVVRGNLRFVAGSVYALPLPADGTDLAFAHAVAEHLGDPAAALEELARVLRPGGVLALVSSDWSGAIVDPPDRDVSLAIEGYRLVRRCAGADPDTGGHLEDLVAAAGFAVVARRSRHHQDMAGPELARYIRERLDSAPPVSASSGASVIAGARAAAGRWADQPAPSRVLQHWTEVIAEHR